MRKSIQELHDDLGVSTDTLDRKLKKNSYHTEENGQSVNQSPTYDDVKEFIRRNSNSNPEKISQDFTRNRRMDNIYLYSMLSGAVLCAGLDYFFGTDIQTAIFDKFTKEQIFRDGSFLLGLPIGIVLGATVAVAYDTIDRIVK